MEMTIYTTTYAAWEEHQDEPTRLRTDESTIELDSVEDASERLGLEGFTEYSSSEWSAHGWYSAETYIDPYTGEREEHSAHLAGFSEHQAREIYARICS